MEVEVEVEEEQFHSPQGQEERSVVVVVRQIQPEEEVAVVRYHCREAVAVNDVSLPPRF